MKKIILVITVTCLLVSSATVITGQKKSVEKTLPISNGDITDLITQLDEAMMEEYINDLVDISKNHYFLSRVTGTAGCEEAKEYINDKFNNMGLETRYHEWTAKGLFGIWSLLTYNSHNVEAILPGADPDSKDIYIVSAHYDTVYRTPSADDNSAGVAAVLSAAEIMSQYTFNHTVRFVAFSGEEQGLLGSHEYAKDAYENCDNIIGVFNFDMIGYTETVEDGKKMRVYENTFSDWIGNLSVDVNDEYNEDIGFDELVRSYDPSGHGSDYLSFWNYGYDAVFNHEYKWNPNKDTGGDTIENMNITYATKVAKLTMATIATLAQSPVTPTSPPEKPASPDGPDSGEAGVEYAYTTYTTDPDGDQVYYLFDWDDGTNSGWLGPYDSGETVTETHTWAEKGDYRIKAKSKDVHGIQSEWSDQLEITMPLNQPSSQQSTPTSTPESNPQSTPSSQPSNQLLRRLSQQLPNAFPILRQLLGQ